MRTAPLPALVALTALFALVAACGAPGREPASSAPSPAAAAPAATSTSPDPRPLAATVTVTGSRSIFQGGDDHIVVYVVNRGRRIDRFALSAGPWLEEHSFAMGSTRLCDQDSTEQYILCGPIEPGQSIGYTIRSIPSSIGEFEFSFRPYEESGGRWVPIPDPAGGEQVLTLRESVGPQTNQVRGYYGTPPPSPSP